MKKSLSLSFPALEVATEIKRPGSKERLIGRNGELNADSNQDLLVAIAALMEVAGTRKVVTEEQATTIAKQSQTHREMVQAAFDSSEELAALGDLMSRNLTQTMARDGFARRFMRYQELQNGQIPQAKMSVKNVTASVATGPVQTHTQIIRELTFFPAEFYITARPFIEMKEIQRSSNDILEDKYVETLEAIMVGEDRLWKRMVDNLIGISNPHLNISGQLTPSAFVELTGYVNDWGVAAQTVLMASDVWSDVVAGAWGDVIDPVAQHELLLTGKLGTIHGMNLLSDRFRHPNHRVLEQGDIYVIGAPDQHGQLTDRGGVDSVPIDIAQEKIPGRGWAFSETVSMVIANDRSVARGKRTK